MGLRRVVLGFVVLACLGCAGFTEQMMEMTTGGDVELTENGMIWRMENGTVFESFAGPGMEVPADMPMPAPWPDATPTSVSTVTVESGDRSYIVSYDMERTAKEIETTYQAWYAEQGLEPKRVEQAKMGTWILVLEAEDAGGSQAVVTLTDAFGFSSVTATYGKDVDELARH